ncbi:Ca2+-binding RTX toxin-like protein [Sinobacterium caligoides]|uniref:Ca2+-binding RTX toxin-like protein n=1 Tax=Sinobacterium caligoides TaxID=933926 RepID=A0A3N2DZ23_9GAMM|nr:calcium-binding protein [Sinobacterium caligoides]ROS05088.1 Ca2+-binding RTX toxin-like protein [Sinobacterium caligoides]
MIKSLGKHIVSALMLITLLQLPMLVSAELVTGTNEADDLKGGDGDDTLRGGAGGDTLDGGLGRDELYGDSGDDTLRGGGGVGDFLQGDQGNDTYEFARGDGHTTINNNDSSVDDGDVLQFLAGIAPSDVGVTRSLSSLRRDLLITVRGPDNLVEVITVSNFFFAAPAYELDAVEFEDETVWDTAKLKLLALEGTAVADNILGYASDDVINGGEGEDTLKGKGGIDHLNGGAGKDNLYGGPGDDVLRGGTGVGDFLQGDQGNDTYEFARGDGHTTINNNDSSVDDGDVLQFLAGIAPSDVGVTRSLSSLRRDLLITVRGPDNLVEVITVSNFFFAAPAYELDAVEFEDETVWDTAKLKLLALEGTAVADNILGYASDDVINGGEGEDTLKGEGGIDHLNGGAGKDNLYGGKGDDVLRGGTGVGDFLQGDQGNDTYEFARGDGHTTINNHDSSVDDGDVLQFLAGIAPSDVGVTRSLSNNRNDLLITVRGPDDLAEVITVSYFFWAAPAYELDAVQFDNGTVWDTDDLKTLAEGGELSKVIHLANPYDDAQHVFNLSAEEVKTLKQSGDASAAITVISEESSQGLNVEALIWWQQSDEKYHVQLPKYYSYDTALEQDVVVDLVDREVDLHKWQAYDISAGKQEGEWDVQNPEGSSVHQSKNTHLLSYFVSDFQLYSDRFEGTFLTNGWDDDYIGFVFSFSGFQSEHYLFSWGNGSQNAQQGINIVRMPANLTSDNILYPGEYGPARLFCSPSQPDTDCANSPGWVKGVRYRFTLSYRQKADGQVVINIRVIDTNKSIGDVGYEVFNTTLKDAIGLKPGRVGFYNWSQPDVSYGGFSTNVLLPPNANTGGPYAFDATLSTIMLDGRESVDPDTLAADNGIVSYRWTLGEGAEALIFDGAEYSLSFAEAISQGLSLVDAVPLRLMVTDSDGLTHQNSTLVSYQNTAPVVALPDGPIMVSSAQTLASMLTSASLTDVDQGFGESHDLQWAFAEDCAAIAPEQGFLNGGAIDLAALPSSVTEIRSLIDEAASHQLCLWASDASGQQASDGVELHLPPAVRSIDREGYVTDVDVTTMTISFYGEVEGFDSADVVVENGSGVAIPITSVEPVEGVLGQYIITFAQVLADDDYTVRITTDITALNGGQAMEQGYQSTFTVDTEDPSTPQLTTAVPRWLDHRGLSLSGTRDADTRIMVTATSTRNPAITETKELASFAETSWSGSFNLPAEAGEYRLRIVAEDRAGRVSAALQLLTFWDANKPVISSRTPNSAEYLSAPVAELRVSTKEYSEAGGSGLDSKRSALLLRRGSVLISGEVTFIDEAAGIVFTPVAPLEDGTYTVTANLVDNAGREALGQNWTFTVDTKKPHISVQALPAVTTETPLQINATSEPGIQFHVSSGEQSCHSAFSDTGVGVGCQANLVQGENVITVWAEDKAGNKSDPVVENVFYDDTIPDAVTFTPTMLEGDGMTVTIDWSAYQAGNDILSYEVYSSPNSFSVLEGVSKQTVVADVSVLTLNGLNRGENFIAVVAVDRAGQSSPFVAQSVTPKDTENVAEVAAVSVVSQADQLTVRWLPVVDSAGDLAQYRLHINGTDYTIDADTVPLEQTVTGLTAATGYPLTLQTIDTAENLSNGLNEVAVTLLANPVIAAPEALDSSIKLAWTPVADESLLKHYAVYVETETFSDVTGKTPKRLLTAGVSEATVSGLTNETTYHVAVTAVNLSGGESSMVSAVTVQPTADSIKPTIEAVRYGAQQLQEGSSHVLTDTAAWQIEASDISGIARVSVSIDGQEIGSSVAGPVYTIPWSLDSVEDGLHTVQVAVYDNAATENEQLASYDIDVQLSKPAAPQITTPANGLITNQPQLTLRGTAPLGTKVNIYRGFTTETLLQALTVDGAGHFAGSVALVEEDSEHSSNVNRLFARTVYTANGRTQEESDDSNAVSVTLETTLPDAPSGLSVRRGEKRQVFISWNPVTMVVGRSPISGYRLYRHTESFEDTAVATPMNGGQLITSASWAEIPEEDGDYYYRVQSVNDLNTPSALSAPAVVSVDGTAPQVIDLQFTALGKYDATTQRYGQGVVELSIAFDERLLAKPFLSIVPMAGGGAIAVALQEDYERENAYRGQFTIEPTTGSGLAKVQLSAFDRASNQLTRTLDEYPLLIDSSGPQVVDIQLSQAAPIEITDTGTALTVTLQLDEAPVETPQFGFDIVLTGSDPYTETIELTQLQADGLRWQGEFTLPANVLDVMADAEGNAASILRFQYQAVDDLANTAVDDTIGRYQVYQGALPPLASPSKPLLQALPDGEVDVSWLPVEGAYDYRLYRCFEDTPGACSQIANYQQLSGVSPLHYIDRPGPDGRYSYRVSSIRKVADETRESAPSDASSVSVDATRPTAPTGLQVEINGAGNYVQWQHDSAVEGIHYQFYRLDGDYSSQSVDLIADGASLLVDNIPRGEALDTRPLGNHSYVVLAVDAAGNRSVPSAAVYQAMNLAPVQRLSVTLDTQGLPLLQWHYPGDQAETFIVYEGEPVDGAPGVELTRSSALQYSDVGYNGGMATDGAKQARRYSIRAIDKTAADNLSPARTLEFAALSAELNEGNELKRGMINKLQYRVDNRGDWTAKAVVLELTVGEQGAVLKSAPFDIAPGESHLAEVVVGGDAALNDEEILYSTLRWQPAAGMEAMVHQQQTLPVGDDTLRVTIEPETFTRGQLSRARFTIDNHGEVPVQVVLAENNGSAVSNEVRLMLEDEEGNILAVQAVQQSDANTQPAGKRLVAEIAAGDSFTSAPMEIGVPASAPDRVELKLLVDKLHYAVARERHVAIDGLAASQTVSLADTPYALLADSAMATPAVIFDDETLQLSGSVVDSSTGERLANVPVKLVIERSGFERSAVVYSDANGDFSYQYQPQRGGSGLYTVSMIHPDVISRPGQVSFTVQGATVSPSLFTLAMPRTYVSKAAIKVTAGLQTDLTGVYAELLPEFVDGEAVLPEGLTVQLDATSANRVDLAAGTSRYLNLTVSGNQFAPAEGSLDYVVRSDQREEIGRIRLDYKLTEAVPLIKVSRGSIVTGLAQGEQLTESIAYSNQGYAPLQQPEFQLIADDQPVDWLNIANQALPNQLDVGDSLDLQLAISPASEDDAFSTPVADGSYYFTLRMTAANYPDIERRIKVNVYQAGSGGVIFNVVDIYTGRPDPSGGEGSVFGGVDGAKIVLQNERTFDSYTCTPSVAGSSICANIAPGPYIYRASKTGHVSETGRLWIRASEDSGDYLSEQIFLVNQLISVDWSVNEVVLEDRYEIKLEASYATKVPAAVVAIEPMMVNLPVMRKGGIYQGEFRITNLGLITAEEMRLSLPADNQYVRYEFLGDVPSSLGANEVFFLPYRVRAVQDFNPDEDGGGTGAGCGSFSGNMNVNYSSSCPSGKAPGRSSARFNANWGGSSCGGGGGGGGGGWSGGWSGGGTGSGDDIGGGRTPISGGQTCAPPPACESCNKEKGENNSAK